MSIFVFGSNLAGRHGAGAAEYAARVKGAAYGVGEGPTGQAYALPTMDNRIMPRTLGDIQKSVDTFIDYAKAHPELTFEVTRVGCGLAGFTDEQIGPMFAWAPDNCLLPPGWRKMQTNDFQDNL